MPQNRIGSFVLSVYKRREEADKLKKLADQSKDILFSAKTVWPFDLFRSDIKLDRHQLTVIKHDMFKRNDTESIQIADILNVEMMAGTMAASLKINSRIATNTHITITNLSRKDADELRKLLQGSIIAYTEEIKIDEIDKEELIKRLIDLGSHAR